MGSPSSRVRVGEGATDNRPNGGQDEFTLEDGGIESFPRAFHWNDFAQGGATGAISGVVQDPTGAVIANAKVSIKSEATGEVLRQVTTDVSGLFTATLLPVGSYTVEVNAAGFPDTKFPGVVVRITETTRMTAVMKVSTVKEVVEVQSQVEQVNTTDATTGQSLGAQTITDLPLATRNFQQLLTLSTGASSDLNNAAQLGRGNVFIHVNGGREDNNNYLIDGITVADYAFGELTYTPLPSPDAIEEFKVSTSLYDATQGRNGGGNINATLKSGTSRFHGDLWEYFRNTALDANDYFLGKVVVKQNIFGGDIGGPIGPGPSSVTSISTFRARASAAEIRRERLSTAPAFTTFRYRPRVGDPDGERTATCQASIPWHSIF